MDSRRRRSGSSATTSWATFPGGTADLDYRFALDGERIERLDIVAG